MSPTYEKVHHFFLGGFRFVVHNFKNIQISAESHLFLRNLFSSKFLNMFLLATINHQRQDFSFELVDAEDLDYRLGDMGWATTTTPTRRIQQMPKTVGWNILQSDKSQLMDFTFQVRFSHHVLRETHTSYMNTVWIPWILAFFKVAEVSWTAMIRTDEHVTLDVVLEVTCWFCVWAFHWYRQLGCAGRTWHSSQLLGGEWTILT